MSNWETISSKIVYKNPWMTVYEDGVIRPDGQKGIYSFVETPPSVYVIPLDKVNNTYLIQLFRYTTKKLSWEVPGGRSDGLSLPEAAVKELEEETGLVSKDVVEIGQFENLNGISTEISHVFLAKNVEQAGNSQSAEEGITQIKKLPFESALAMIYKGEITDGQSINALFYAALALGYAFIR